ncbi:MAG: SusD/RagB family nutrient-binding outer membrane lipoprotein [Pedobacter sp.]
MKKLKYIYTTVIAALVLTSSSCEKFYDVNADPDAILQAPMPTILTSVTANVAYFSGSDLNRFSLLLMQQYSGQSNGTLNQTQEYDKYLITGNDSNNLFSAAFANILNDIENIIKIAEEEGSPNYSGVAKLLKAYMYQIMIDTYGDLPYAEAQKLTLNVAPKYDDDEQIYKNLITLIDEGIAGVNATTSKQVPTTNSTIYPGAFATTKTNWVKFANTLKLRIYLHYSEKEPALVTSQMNALIASGATFMAANADNFQMNFLNIAGGRNPIDQFETSRAGYLVAGNQIVSMMNTAADPRRASYFSPFTTAPIYRGAVVGAANNSTLYSKLHTYLRGSLAGTTYTGDAPVRMLTFAEYNFIRAEAALRFNVTGVAQTFFTAGITASMTAAGVSTTDQATYLLANGTLTGTPAQQLKQIIDQKYIANYGVNVEPWTDWRRTGYPALTLPANAVIAFTPRSLYYPQSEIDSNPNLPGGAQKTSLGSRVFWDTRQ